jgi:hypothetical protein
MISKSAHKIVDQSEHLKSIDVNFNVNDNVRGSVKTPLLCARRAITYCLLRCIIINSLCEM